MEDLMFMSMFSHANLDKNEESSDSNFFHISHGRERSRIERFKGVVPQQNGHWGAQIYANHHRIWLGTFKSEIDAAMAYDTAAIKLRSGDSHRNFPWTNFSIQEPKFQSHFSTDAVLNMIRDGSYPSKFAEFLRSQKGELELGLTISSLHGDGQFSCTLLFDKELRPSDVGKLNRLVIPKRHAVKHFPNVPDLSDDSLDSGRADHEVQLEFYDKQMRLWKFRYCYWKSSQSFVFTRGWNRFVKEKNLIAKDTISFYKYECRGGFGQSFLVIDKATERKSRIEDTAEMISGGNNIKYCGGVTEEMVESEDHEMMASTPCKVIKGIRLFGVQIDGV